MRAILACDPKGGIGKDNNLPWDRLDGDLKRFQQLTTGGTVVMGRNTWNSLPIKPLPNRYNKVVTSHGDDLREHGAKQLLNLDFISDTDWLIGGATLFKSCYHNITELHLSITYSVYDCDTFIDLDKIYQNFKLVSRTEHSDHAYEVLKK